MDLVFWVLSPCHVGVIYRHYESALTAIVFTVINTLCMYMYNMDLKPTRRQWWILLIFYSVYALSTLQTDYLLSPSLFRTDRLLNLKIDPSLFYARQIKMLKLLAVQTTDELTKQCHHKQNNHISIFPYPFPVLDSGMHPCRMFICRHRYKAWKMITFLDEYTYADRCVQSTNLLLDNKLSFLLLRDCEFVARGCIKHGRYPITGVSTLQWSRVSHFLHLKCQPEIYFLTMITQLVNPRHGLINYYSLIEEFSKSVKTLST